MSKQEVRGAAREAEGRPAHEAAAFGVVIVEDETLVRLGMRMCIKESRERLEVRGAFSSAEEALDFLREHPADILLTDIRLGKMSGLDLIREARALYPALCVVVLSYYDDFEYARQGINLNVDRYLLKHEVDEEALPGLLYELAAQKLCAGRRWPSAAVSAVAAEEGAAAQEEEGGGGPFRLGLLLPLALGGPEQAAGEGEEDAGALNRSLLLEAVQNRLERLRLGRCSLHRDREIFCRFDFSAPGGAPPGAAGSASARAAEEGRIRDFFADLRPGLAAYFNLDLHLLYSEPFHRPEEGREQRARLRAAAEQLFYFERASCVALESLPARGAQRAAGAGTSLLRLDCVGLFTIFNAEWKAEVEARFRDMLAQARAAGLSPFELKTDIAAFLKLCEAHLKTFHAEAYEGYARRDGAGRPGLAAIDSAAALRAYFHAHIEALCEAVRRRDALIHRIDEYILRHYTEAISLPRIAETFHLSPAYFCQYFKKKKGSSLITYVNLLRVERAKELLSRGELSLEEVAERVGLGNANYFSRLFKKVSGQSVADYRRQISLERAEQGGAQDPSRPEPGAAAKNREEK